MPVDALHFIMNHLKIKLLSPSTNDLQSHDTFVVCINQSIPVSLWMLSVDRPLCQALLFNHETCLQANDYVCITLFHLQRYAQGYSHWYLSHNCVLPDGQCGLCNCIGSSWDSGIWRSGSGKFRKAQFPNLAL